MALTSVGYQAPATERVGTKPSILDAVIITGAADTPMISLIGHNSKAKNVKHGWIIDPLGDPKKNAQIEISGFSGAGSSTKQKTENAVQIFTTDIMVSEDMKHISNYGSDEMAHQVNKKAKEHAKDLEAAVFGLFRGADLTISEQRKGIVKAPKFRAAGVTTSDSTLETASEMAGFGHFIMKEEMSTDGVSGASWTQNSDHGRKGNFLTFANDGSHFGWLDPSVYTEEQELTWERFNELLQVIWDNGESPTDVFVGASLKKAINGFVTRQYKDETAYVGKINSLDTDFGTVNIRLHRYLTSKYGTGDVLLAGNKEYATLAPLVSTKLSPVSTDMTAEAKRYYTSLTLETKNVDAWVMAAGLKSA